MQLTQFNGSFYYRDDQGIFLPSVKTILTKTQSSAAKASLLRWRNKIGNNNANRILVDSRHRGKFLHQMIQQFLQGVSPELKDSNILPYWHSIQPALKNLSDVQSELLETMIPNYTDGYAGRVDCIARYRGIPHAIEWTSAEKPKWNKQDLFDKPLQVTAYAGAINRQYGEQLFGVKITRALIIVALPEEDAQIFQFERDELIQYWNLWRKRVKLFYEMAA